MNAIMPPKHKVAPSITVPKPHEATIAVSKKDDLRAWIVNCDIVHVFNTLNIYLVISVMVMIDVAAFRSH